MKTNKKRRSGVKMNNQILQSIRDSAIASGDHSKLMLIEQLEQAYDAMESMKASYNAMLAASSGVAFELKKKDEIILNLQSANMQLTNSMNQMLAGWKSLFELSVYSSNMFNCYDLLDLWKLVDKFFGSKNQEEMQLNSLELMSSASKLNASSVFVDMRNRMVSYKEYYESTFGSVADIVVPAPDVSESQVEVSESQIEDSTSQEQEVQEISLPEEDPENVVSIKDVVQDHNLQDHDVQEDNSEQIPPGLLVSSLIYRKPRQDSDTPDDFEKVFENADNDLVNEDEEYPDEDDLEE